MANAPSDDISDSLRAVQKGFDHLFSNDLGQARDVFAREDTPFHLMGLGVCAFLEAALGMEVGLLTEATRCLTLSEAGARKQTKVSKQPKTNQRRMFPPGLEWEVMHADSILLLGLTNALSESYMGYLSCMYSLNNAHSKFTKLYKQVFPSGLSSYATPAASPPLSRTSSISDSSSVSRAPSVPTPVVTKSKWSLGRWASANTSRTSLAVPTVENTNAHSLTYGNGAPEGIVDDFIVAGTAFGYGLFNLTFSLLPRKVQSVVGWLGFSYDRRLALQALAVAAAGKDVHSVYAGLALMTYHAGVLLLSGYQADQDHIMKQYKAIVDSLQTRYPTGALGILNRAKIQRMSHDPEGAIQVLYDGLKPERRHTFVQADTLLVFELAWTLLQQQRYQEAADAFIRITSLNSWSHATYYYLAAGCYFSLGNKTKAQELLDAVPDMLAKKKVGGKDLPTEVFITKKIAFYKSKQKRLGGDVNKYVEAIRISPAEELSLFWNTHAHVDKSIAESYIATWSALTPVILLSSVSPSTPSASSQHDLDTPDELALRALLLGILHRTTHAFDTARSLLLDAHSRQADIEVSTWIGGVALFELAVLELMEAEAHGAKSQEWHDALKKSTEWLEDSLAITTHSMDLSSRLEGRIALLKEEIRRKGEMVDALV